MDATPKNVELELTIAYGISIVHTFKSKIEIKLAGTVKIQVSVIRRNLLFCLRDMRRKMNCGESIEHEI